MRTFITAAVLLVTATFAQAANYDVESWNSVGCTGTETSASLDAPKTDRIDPPGCIVATGSESLYFHGLPTNCAATVWPTFNDCSAINPPAGQVIQGTETGTGCVDVQFGAFVVQCS